MILSLMQRAVPARHALIVVLLSTTVALLEAFGVLLLVPLLGLVGIGFGPVSSEFAVGVSSALRTLGIPLTLISVLAVYVLVVSVQAWVAYLEATSALRLRESVAARMRNLLYGSITRMRWRSFIERSSSDYVHALTTQLERAHLAVAQAMSFVAQLLIAIVYAGIALWITPGLSLVALAGGAVLVLLGRRYSRVLQTRGEELSEATHRLHEIVVEHLSNMKVAKTLGAESLHIRHFEDASDQVVSTWTATGAAFGGARRIFTIGAAVLLAVIVYAAVSVFNLGPAAVLLLLYAFARLVPRIGALQQLLHQIIHALPAVRATAADLSSYEAAAAASASAAVSASHEVSMLPAVEFRDVWFGYAPARELLRGVDLTIGAGGITLITGPSGAGKTTIADLLLGLLDPGAGQIRVGDRPLAEIPPAEWRSRTAYVPQESVLFNDSVRNNLLWAAPGAAEAQVVQALNAAQAEFVFALPRGLDTVVGERGMWLSGGERQRLAIARALLRDPRLLILDEPTSSLDAENEQRVFEVLRSLRGRLTVVLISHRHTARTVADRIFLVDGGEVTAISESAPRGLAVSAS